MPPDESWVLRNLRATRADPPGLAAEDPYRRAIYGAGLEQFEQLLEASRAVSAAARPLPLFYALSQAGRAIVAARGTDPDIDGHGLAEDRQHKPDDLLQRRIKRIGKAAGKDAFGAVSKVVRSPEVTGGFEIGALWATLGPTFRMPKESWLPEWRGTLWLMDQPTRRRTPGQTKYQLWSMSGNPHLGPIETIVGRYPMLPADAKWGPKGSPDDLGGPGNWAMIAEWSDSYDLDKIAPEIRGHNTREVIPTLPGQTELLPRLMTWWLLLFGLSIFARYHPGLWAGALRVDQSPTAVPLEAILESGLESLPRLVYDQVLGAPGD
jgi:hypothetical protein